VNVEIATGTTVTVLIGINFFADFAFAIFVRKFFLLISPFGLKRIRGCFGCKGWCNPRGSSAHDL
jgi:hypothetical protein